jgi:hypothetical protein
VADDPALIAAQRRLAVLTTALVTTQFFLAGAPPEPAARTATA